MQHLHRADLLPAAALHAAFGEAFADYLAGPFQLSLADWPGFLARQCADLRLSRAALDDDGQVLAFALTAPRTHRRRWRLATMGATPAARGSGAAAALLADFIARAAAAGQRGVELEVFAQNTRALRLYQHQGFVPVAELHGYAVHDAAAPPGPADPQAADAVPRSEALAWLDAAEAQGLDLPLQLGAAVLAVAPDWTAWRRGSAQLVFADGPEGSRRILSLVDRDPAQRDAEALARALRAAAAGRALTLPPLLPPALGGDALRRAGFAPQPLHQLLMRRAAG